VSGDLERSGQPNGAQATVAPVWWRGIELTALSRSEFTGGGGGGGQLDFGRTSPNGKPRVFAAL